MESLVQQDIAEFKSNDNAANQNDSGCETSTTKSIDEILNTSITRIENINISVLKTNPQTQRKLINKTAYAKLQRSLSPTRNSQLISLKSKYEKSDNENENDNESEVTITKVEQNLIRHKSKLPLPTPRHGIKSEIIAPSQKISDKFKYRHSLMLDKKPKKKDENSNEVFRKSSSSSGEFITIVPRSESIETIDKLEKELDLFTMDKKIKDKKRTSSFRRIFSGKIFSKEKKKKDESENIFQQKRDNLQNENYLTRHSLGHSNIPKPIPQETHQRIPPPNINMQEVERRYAQMRVKEFNNIKQNFENQNNQDEIDQIPTVTPGPMDFNKLPNINKFIDTSSSASIESEKEQDSPYKAIRFAENQRDTPPRAQELRQDVRLVNPKALIPINSERPLPNPYQNTNKPVISPKPQTFNKQNYLSQHPSSSDDKISHPILDETYGTVFDNIDKKDDVWVRNSSTKINQKPPRSPSLEPSKIRLPPNRDIGPMSPRMRSPIPHHHVSTEKLIATELLRGSRSPTPTKRKNQLSSSHLKLDLTIDYPDNVQRATVTSKPPVPRVPDQLSPNRNYQASPKIPENGHLSANYENRNIQSRNYQASKISQNGQPSPNYENKILHSLNYENRYPQSRIPENVNLSRISPLTPKNQSLISSQERLVGNTIMNSTAMRSPTPNTLLQSPELFPLRAQSSRSSTPVDLRIPPSSSTPSPQKEEMRRNVEAYYWKEIKKLKEQENIDLYYYQMQIMPFGYAEDPIYFRKSRSSSPSSQRNGRRSLSLPRDPKSQENIDNYRRYQPVPIPEGRAIINYPNYQQNFRRNAPERRTIDSVPRTNGNSIYRPIFKRGSLTTPVRELEEDQQQKKVSFTGGQQKVWPTRNGYTQSPPQRRPDSIDDDVFLPNQQQTSKLIVDGKEIYGYTNRPYDHIPRQQDPQYQNANFYKQIQQDPIYNSKSNDNRIPRYNSMQLAEPLEQHVARRMSYDNSPRRQIYVKDDIYGYFGGYVPNDQQSIIYSSRQNITEPTYGYTRGVPKQITVRDKVCDMYGQIHDRDSPSMNIRKSGVMLGQLHPNQNFVRNSRLTASANDMNRRYQNVDPRYVVYQAQNEMRPPRPLPPVPMDKRLYYRQNTDNIPEFSDVQRTSSLEKSKKRGTYGQSEPTVSDDPNLERAILLEQLQLIKQQQELEMKKQQWKLNNNFKNNYEKLGRHPLETKMTEQLSISDLKKLVLEELKLLRLKIKCEINVK